MTILLEGVRLLDKLPGDLGINGKSTTVFMNGNM